MTQPEPSQDLISGGAREPEPQFILTPVSSDNYMESWEFWHKNIASPTLACTILSALAQYFAALRIGFLSSAQQGEITREGLGKVFDDPILADLAYATLQAARPQQPSTKDTKHGDGGDAQVSAEGREIISYYQQGSRRNERTSGKIIAPRCLDWRRAGWTASDAWATERSDPTKFGAVAAFVDECLETDGFQCLDDIRQDYGQAVAKKVDDGLRSKLENSIKNARAGKDQQQAPANDPVARDDGKDKNLSKRKALPKPRAKGGNNQAFAVGGGQDLSDDENEAPKTSDKVALKKPRLQLPVAALAVRAHVGPSGSGAHGQATLPIHAAGAAPATLLSPAGPRGVAGGRAPLAPQGPAGGVTRQHDKVAHPGVLAAVDANSGGRVAVPTAAAKVVSGLAAPASGSRPRRNSQYA